MIKSFTQRVLIFLCFICSTYLLQAQTIITQWNFNDGTTNPSTGTGTISLVGTAAVSPFPNGSGSTDAATPNLGYGVNTWPAQGTGSGTRGIEFGVSTAGQQNIVLRFDMRPSNTSPRHFQVQYTLDRTAASPVWTTLTEDFSVAGDAFINDRAYNFSSITGLNNNANAGFRIMAVFAPGTSAYEAATTTSTYATTGNWRFDMVTVLSAPPPAVSFVGNNVSVSEGAATVNIPVRIQLGNTGATTVNFSVLPVSTATAGADFTLPSPAQLSFSALSDGVTENLSVTINNDALPENTEYFIVKMESVVNGDLPAAASNHFTVFIQDDDKQGPGALQSVVLNHIASFSNGAAGANSAEIVAHDPATQRLFIANSVAGKIDIVNFSNPASATLINSIDVRASYGNINSVAVKNSILAAAIEDANPQLPGKVVFFDMAGTYLNQVQVGAMPDMITFNNAGTKVLTANEGEPNADYSIDPEGSISIIDISGGIASLTQANVTTAGFTAFNAQAAALRTAGVRIFGANNPTVAQDLEPEYITISADDNTAYVTLQENNAIAVVNINTATVTDIRPLGTKDHSLARNAFDASDNGGSIRIANWPVKGVYMPDAIASYTVGGQMYLVTANEGDAREYSTYVEVKRLNDPTYVLDPTVFPNAAALKANTNLGRLNVTTASGDLDGDGDFDEIHTLGARSFSIWNASTGELVWDSGDELEEITARHPQYGVIFNASNANNTPKNRSDDKGPEPEGVAIAVIAGKTYAFIALERTGGCMVYDVTDPANPVYVDYKNTRDLAAFGGDNGAEGILFIDAASSPTGQPIVILANEVSSTLTFFSVNNISLPIVLREIKATNIGHRNLVQWTTENEQAGDEVELQRSRNGRNFTTIATITARGTASSYRQWDETPFSGINYYRLKLKHTGKGHTYSAVVSAIVKGAPARFGVYPNPVQNELTINVGKTPAAGAVVDIIDINGRVAQRVRLVNGIETINMSKLPAGVYTLRYSDGEAVETVRVMKQ